MMQVKLLGGLELDRETTPAPTRQTASLLVVLALARPRGLSRDRLTAMFWPDRAEPQARASLRQALTTLRRFLADSRHALTLVSDGETLGLEGPTTAVDVWQLREALGAPPRMLEAAALYRGELLEGVALDGALAAWVAPHAAELQRQALDLVARLSRRQPMDATVATSTEALARRLLARDPTAERAWRALIRVQVARGERNAARRELAACERALADELGVEPEAATTALLTDAPPAPEAAPSAIPPAATAPSPPARSSLVVMPFDNLGPPEDAYFAQGVVEEITAALSRIRDFLVIARQSAFAYQGRFVDVREVGRELGVRYVVEGTVRRGGDRVRISVQLVDAASRAQLWSDRYDGETTDIFAFQDAIAAQVAGAIQPSIRSSEIRTARSKAPENLTAYDLLLRAYPHFWAHDRAENALAIRLLDQALIHDPDYGVAMALKSWCHAQEACYMWAHDSEGERATAVRLADRAAGLVEDHATGLVAIGAAYGIATTDQARAALHIERALAIDPNHAWGWTRLGWATYLRGRPDEAIAHFDKALELSPLDPLAFNVQFGKAAACSLKRDFAQAIEFVEKGLNAHPQAVWAYRMLASYHARNGDMPRAEAALSIFRRHYPEATVATIRAAMPPAVHDIDPAYLDGIIKAGLPLQ
jgi:TolB-like protein